MEVRYFVGWRRWWALVDGVKSPTFESEHKLLAWVQAKEAEIAYSYCASMI